MMMIIIIIRHNAHRVSEGALLSTYCKRQFVFHGITKLQDGSNIPEVLIMEFNKIHIKVVTLLPSIYGLLMHS